MTKTIATTDVTPLPAAAAKAAKARATGGYANVRFNAMKHGVLSRYTVLSHEDGDEYQSLLEALVREHQPSGATEAHLVEELTGAIWRKRRVLQAEGATINQGLRGSARDVERVVATAVPFERGLGGVTTELRDLVELTPKEAEERRRAAAQDLAATQKAQGILLRGGPDAYDQALQALEDDSRDWWLEHVDEGAYPEAAEGLLSFIDDHLYKACLREDKEARHAGAIKAQAFGEGLQAHRLEKLNRYESHLDRKFERTLAMLLKLKEVRRAS